MLPYFLHSDLSWSVPVREPVAMILHDSKHYNLNDQDSASEFAQLLPSGGHVVHLGEELSTHTISMFHQLKCLDIIREAYNSPLNSSMVLPQHCLNYLRQRFLCRPNLQLESARFGGGTKPLTSKPYDVVCPDWTAIYDAAEENYNDYMSAVART